MKSERIPDQFGFAPVEQRLVEAAFDGGVITSDPGAMLLGAIEGLFVDLFLEAHQRPPRQITLDLDASDDSPHGDQEGRFFLSAAKQSILLTAWC